MVNMLYNIIILKLSIFFCVTYDHVTVSVTKFVTVTCHITVILILKPKLEKKIEKKKLRKKWKETKLIVFKSDIQIMNKGS